MRGRDGIAGSLFSYGDLEKRVRPDHPLWVIRDIVNATLTAMSAEFDALYAADGRVSILPERLLRALLLQAFYTIRSEMLPQPKVKALLSSEHFSVDGTLLEA
jgi:transposase